MPKWWDKIPKKLIALAIGAGVQLLPFDQDTKHQIAQIVMAFLVGQGIADHGKEREKIILEHLPPLLPIEMPPPLATRTAP
jgi:hypothetical protein